MKDNNKIQKVCCFYASDWHLTVMLLPYIDKKIKEDYSIFMRCENNIEEKMNTLINKLSLKNKENIMNISWNNMVAEENDCNNNKIYIVSGDEEYIREINESIDLYYSEKEENVKIINCYEINKSNLNSIIEKNNYSTVLNTKGECKISKNIAKI